MITGASVIDQMVLFFLFDALVGAFSKIWLLYIVHEIVCRRNGRLSASLFAVARVHVAEPLLVFHSRRPHER